MYRLSNDPRPLLPLPELDPSDEGRLGRRIGPGCSLVLAAPPCLRCYALIKHGAAEGLWPTEMIDTCIPSECTMCRHAWPALELLEHCFDVRVCWRHRDAFAVRRRHRPDDPPPVVARAVNRRNTIWVA
jgi:hypothetical protein